MAERERKPTQFSPQALAYRRRLVEQAPPLPPEAQAIIRAAFTPPPAAKKPKAGRKTDHKAA